MPSRFNLMFRPNRPQDQGVSQSHGNAANDAPVPARQARNPGPNQSIQLLLSHLRINNEPDHKLINAPTGRNGALAVPRAPTDQNGAGLTGRAFLQFLSTDIRLLPAFKRYIGGGKVLGNNLMTEAAMNAFAERLRPIVSQAYHDQELLLKIDGYALEFMGYCDDRKEFFLGQMETAAILSNLSRGELDEATLYNLGVSFFKLDEVRAAVGRRTANGIHSQNVHDYLQAEFHLQDELELPTRHERPVYPGMGVITQQVALDIGNEVKRRLFENDGENVMRFMSLWEPWKAHLQTAAQHTGDYEVLLENYQGILAVSMDERTIPGSAMAVLSEANFLDHIGDIRARLSDWNTEYTGQLTKSFLTNERANYLMDRGSMPRFFYN